MPVIFVFVVMARDAYPMESMGNFKCWWESCGIYLAFSCFDKSDVGCFMFAKVNMVSMGYKFIVLRDVNMLPFVI
ncbi:hypothetical protein PATY110618_24185 [Paenibacillus typhae]|uniref:Uncharacterized protein n=1 Tax=Paenibacillus typhae TaxID=1174501 RepID=A0A1G8F9S7_9BACL|nr:hypothetical protein SAMN05216192_101177 [Paenibacillus typhae]